MKNTFIFIKQLGGNPMLLDMQIQASRHREIQICTSKPVQVSGVGVQVNRQIQVRSLGSQAFGSTIVMEFSQHAG